LHIVIFNFFLFLFYLCCVLDLKPALNVESVYRLDAEVSACDIVLVLR